MVTTQKNDAEEIGIGEKPSNFREILNTETADTSVKETELSDADATKNHRKKRRKKKTKKKRELLSQLKTDSSAVLFKTNRIPTLAHCHSSHGNLGDDEMDY